MPIYEYRCENGHTFEVMQRMAEDPLVTCETCGAAVQRVLSAPAIHFKGSGFYNTDYGTKRRARETAAAAEGNKDGKASAGASDGGERKSTAAAKSGDGPKSSDKGGKSTPAAASGSD